MALKSGMKLGVANKPKLVDGWACGLITSVGIGQGTVTNRKAKDDIDQHTYERLEIGLAVDGITGTINMPIHTGLQLNGPLDTMGRGANTKTVYNRLTTLALALGVVTLEQVNDDEQLAALGESDEFEKKIMALEGAKVQFKLTRVDGVALPVPDISTFKLVAD